jgi:hypothetical protein
MSISIDDFKTKVDGLKNEYSAKHRELRALQNKFEVLVNSIELQTKMPDDCDAPDYDELDDKRYQEQRNISDVVGDLVYDFDLSWDGSFEEGENSFWVPSNC